MACGDTANAVERFPHLPHEGLAFGIKRNPVRFHTPSSDLHQVIPSLMTVCLVMCAGGGNAQPVEAVESVRSLIDSYLIADSGLEPETRRSVEESVAGLEGRIVDREFAGSGPSFTWALNEARGTADWLLHLHSDEEADVQPGLRDWLADDPWPTIDSWQIPIVNPHLVHKLPRLLRGDKEWRYVGNAHEYLEIDHSRNSVWLTGLSLIHKGWSNPDKFEYVLSQLAEEREAGDPRATFYTAEALRDLGRTDEAISVYRERAAMAGTWEEERWYAEFQAAKLAGDTEGLISVHRLRPWRPEPLRAAAELASRLPSDDVLFVETL